MHRSLIVAFLMSAYQIQIFDNLDALMLNVHYKFLNRIIWCFKILDRVYQTNLLPFILLCFTGQQFGALEAGRCSARSISWWWHKKIEKLLPKMGRYNCILNVFLELLLVERFIFYCKKCNIFVLKSIFYITMRKIRFFASRPFFHLLKIELIEKYNWKTLH